MSALLLLIVQHNLRTDSRPETDTEVSRFVWSSFFASITALSSGLAYELDLCIGSHSIFGAVMVLYCVAV